MNRYDLKEVDCILAMSGGMDCVVLLHWLLERDRKPLIFFKAEQSNGCLLYTSPSPRDRG